MKIRIRIRIEKTGPHRDGACVVRAAVSAAVSASVSASVSAAVSSMSFVVARTLSVSCVFAARRPLACDIASLTRCRPWCVFRSISS